MNCIPTVVGGSHAHRYCPCTIFLGAWWGMHKVSHDGEEGLRDYYEHASMTRQRRVRTRMLHRAGHVMESDIDGQVYH